jgi:hypothetical protein
VRRAALAGIGTLLLVVSGCGSGTQLSKAEFDAKVRTICAQYTKRAQRELALPGIYPTSPAASALDIAKFGRFIGHVATLFDEQLDDLSALRPPAESAQAYSEVLTTYRQIDGALFRAARAARKGDRKGIAELTQELDAAGRQADALGFKCE